MSWPAPFDDGELRRRLGVETSLRRVRQGARVGQMGPEADVVVVLEGAFALRAEGRWVQGVEAPVTSGLDAWLAKQPWTLERCATEPTLYASVSRQALDWAIADRPGLTARLAHQVALESCALRGRDVAQARDYDELFTPGPGARLAPGPYRLHPFDAVVLLMEDDPARLRATLPEGLRLTPDCGGRYLLVASFVEHAHPVDDVRASFGYREVALLVPVLSDHGLPGLFSVAFYTDAAMPVLLGREIYGFPTRLGRIERRAEGFGLVVGHREALRVHLGEGRAADAAELGQHLLGRLFAANEPTSLSHGLGLLFGSRARDKSATDRADARVWLHTPIASEAPHARSDSEVSRLTEVPVTSLHMEAFNVLDEAVVELDDDQLPLGGHLRAAARCQLSFDLGEGRL